MKKVYGEKHPNAAASLNNLGSAWRSLGDYPKAIRYIEQALEIRKEICGEAHPQTAASLYNLGKVYFALNEKEKVKDYFEKAYGILDKSFGPEHPEAKKVSESLKSCD